VALFSKKTEPSSPAPEAAGEEEVVHIARSYTPGKGKATPKRTDAQRTRKSRSSLSPKEQREQRRKDKAEAYEGMKAGDERYLLPRDKGPERALVRDIVDSRRTVGPYFFAGAFLLLFLLQVNDRRIAAAANIIWFMLAFAVIVDSMLISRKIKRMVRERFPKTTQKFGSLYFYGIMRAISFRKLRMPKTRVKIGDRI